MKLRIGTRKSKLAMAQTMMAVSRLKAQFPLIETEIVAVSTKGDRISTLPLSQIGGKGIFVSEIENMLLSGEIDAAVHSGKDLPVKLAAGTEISGVLPRGDYRDVLLTAKGKCFSEGDSFKVGTGSLRRRMNLKSHFPNAVFSEIRGNIDTRLQKLRDGEYEGIILAAAGIERLGLSLDDLDSLYFNWEDFLPAPCQGIIAIQCLAKSPAAQAVREICDKNTFACFETEREAVSLLGGDCGKPVGAYSTVSQGKLFLRLTEDSVHFAQGEGEIQNKSQLVRELISKL